MKITSIQDLAAYLGTKPTPEAIGRTLYKHTDCGPWSLFYYSDGSTFHYNDPGEPDFLATCLGIKLGTIVEGSPAEFASEPMMFPFESDELEQALTDLDGQVNDYNQEKYEG